MEVKKKKRKQIRTHMRITEIVNFIEICQGIIYGGTYNQNMLHVRRYINQVLERTMPYEGK